VLKQLNPAITQANIFKMGKRAKSIYLPLFENISYSFMYCCTNELKVRYGMVFSIPLGAPPQTHFDRHRQEGLEGDIHCLTQNNPKTE